MTKLFECTIGHRPDLSGRPYGFWFGWRPQPATYKYGAVKFAWTVGFYFYPAPFKIGFRGVGA